MSVSLVSNNNELRDKNLNKKIIDNTNLNEKCSQLVLSYLPFENVAARVLENPAKLLDQHGQMISDSYSLGECECYHYDRHGQGEISQRRGKLEDGVLSQLASRPKDQVLRVVDIGAGSCFSSLINLVKLVVRDRFLNVEYTVIDPKYAHGQASVTSLRECVASEVSCLAPASHVTITDYSSLDTYLGQLKTKEREMPHVTMMVDLDDAEAAVRGQVLYEMSLVPDSLSARREMIIGHTEKANDDDPKKSRVEAAPFPLVRAGHSAEVQGHRTRLEYEVMRAKNPELGLPAYK